MADKVMVNGVDVTHAVKDDFVVGSTFELSDGRVIEVRQGKPKMRDAIAVAEALGTEATTSQQNIELLCRRIRLKGGGRLTHEDIVDMDLDDGNALIEVALGKNFTPPPTKPSPHSSGTASAQSGSKS